MLEILNIPDIRNHVAPVTVERYHRMIEAGMFDDWNVELLNGVLVEKMSKSALHIFIVDYLLEKLEDVCPGAEFWLRQELPITIGDSEPEPDISVIRGKRSELRKRKPVTADFVIEVAISSVAVDREKAGDYTRAGIAEYWMVCPKRKRTTIFRRPENGGYRTKIDVSSDTVIESEQIEGFQFDLAAALCEFAELQK